MSGRSLSFDRAADFYDATREAPPDQLAASIATLNRHLPEGEPILEIGIGTGRMAIPFAATGRTLYGIDISARMLDKLKEKSTSIPLARADATRLPFGEATFGGAYTMWVLHLVEDWREALREAARVIRAKGSLLVTIGGLGQGFGTGPWADILADFKEVTGIERNLGATTLEEIDEFMTQQGWPGRDAGTFTHEIEVPPAEMLRRLRENIFSFTWPLSEEKRLSAADEVERRARDRFEDLGKPLPNGFPVQWRVYEIG